LLAGSGDARLSSDAAQVALMRDGNRTVVTLAMDYQGPAEDFVMIVPVPTKVSPDDVRTLPPGIFDRLDGLTAPRLVEYWEEDPCPVRSAWDETEDRRAPTASAPPAPAPARTAAPAATARTEAQFTAGEYDVVQISAADAGGLDRFLKANKLQLPDGALAALRPYAQANAKLLVLRVDAERMRYENGRGVLSPVRFQYDEPVLTVPLRLGAVTSEDVEDVLVYVLAPHQRYEAASYPNVTAPTNIEVAPAVKASFGSFFAALESSAVAASPSAFVTEYAWAAGSCEPCAVAPLSDAELTLLGADVIPSTSADEDLPEPPPAPSASHPQIPGVPGVPGAPGVPLPLGAHDAGVPAFVPTHDAVAAIPGGLPRDFVVTRLHARLAKRDIGDDLELRKVPPIEGGREFSGGHAPVTLTADASSSFQARYFVRNGWSGAVDCDDPRWGTWGGADKESPPTVDVAHDVPSAPADAGAPLATLVAGEVPALHLHGTLSPPAHTWRRSIASRVKDPWVAFAIGLALGTIGLAIIANRGGKA
jgi:hypothetical protein